MNDLINLTRSERIISIAINGLNTNHHWNGVKLKKNRVPTGEYHSKHIGGTCARARMSELREMGFKLTAVNLTQDVKGNPLLNRNTGKAIICHCYKLESIKMKKTHRLYDLVEYLLNGSKEERGLK